MEGEIILRSQILTCTSVSSTKITGSLWTGMGPQNASSNTLTMDSGISEPKSRDAEKAVNLSSPQNPPWPKEPPYEISWEMHALASTNDSLPPRIAFTKLGFTSELISDSRWLIKVGTNNSLFWSFIGYPLSKQPHGPNHDSSIFLTKAK